MYLLVRFLSEMKEKVVVCFLKALFFGHAKGVNAVDSIGKVIFDEELISHQIACLTYNQMVLMLIRQYGEKLNEPLDGKIPLGKELVVMAWKWKN